MTKIRDAIYDVVETMLDNRPMVVDGVPTNKDKWDLWVKIVIGMADALEDYDRTHTRESFLIGCGYLDYETRQPIVK